MDFQLKAQLKNDILVAKSTAVNMYGEKSYGAAVSHKGRQIGRQTWVKNNAGQDVRSDHQVIFTSTVDVDYGSLIWLQGESTASYSGWPVLAIAVRYGEDGSSDHIKVFLGAVSVA